MIRYTHKTHWKVEYVCTTDGRKITSVLTGLVWLGGIARKPFGPGFDGSEPATRWKGSNRSWVGWDES